MSHLLAISSVMWLMGASPSSGQVSDPWIGHRVITKFGTVLKEGNRIVDREGREPPLAGDDDWRLFRFYRVDKTQGRWFWISSESSLASGWVRYEDIVPVERAADYLTGLIRARPSAHRYLHRAIVWKDRGEDAKALADLTEVLRLDPEEEVALFLRGEIYAAGGDHRRALADFDEAIRINPEATGPLMARSELRFKLKDYPGVIADLSSVIRVRPEDAHAFHVRGVSWELRGDHAKAFADLARAVRLDPRSRAALGSLVFVLITCRDKSFRDGKRAVELATQICASGGWKNAADIDLLAAAYAEDGDFDSAVRWQQKAVELADDQQRGEFEERLDFYNHGTKYYDAYTPVLVG
jgi:tetratricopeptide (TPR) repeat protein